MTYNEKAPTSSFPQVVGQVFEAVNARGLKKRYLLQRFLGGGATSVVWLAQEVDEQGSVQGKPVAVKALKLKTEAQWRDAFEDEIQVLRTLREAEERLKDGYYAIPEVYDVSPKGISPAYLAMEFVPHAGVDKWVQPHNDLIECVKLLRETGEAYREQLVNVTSDLRAVLGQDEALVSDMQALTDQELSLADLLREVSRKVEETLRERRGLSDGEVCQIGAQVCRVLQLLHESGRGYQDFQLQDVRWDRDHWRVKIIDWNVVTPLGQVDLAQGRGREYVQRDLARLSSYLFYLCTAVRAPEGGASPRSLARQGGPAWSECTSLALRLVLERALDPDLRRRYAQAFDFEEKRGSLMALSELRSLGAALSEVSRWHGLSAGELMALAVRCKDAKLTMETRAVIQLARQNLKQEHDELQHVMAERLDQLEKDIGPMVGRPSFELGLELLEARDIAGAVAAFEQAVADAPDDLEAHRWLALARSLSNLSWDERQRLWQSKQLQVAMKALQDERWTEAMHAFDSVARDEGGPNP
jgi:hypothetical protein